MFGFGKNKGKKEKTKAEIIAEAHANARQARAVIGQETIEKIAAEIADKNPFEDLVPEYKEKRELTGAAKAAKELLCEMDGLDLANHLRFVIDEDKV